MDPRQTLHSAGYQDIWPSQIQLGVRGHLELAPRLYLARDSAFFSICPRRWLMVSGFELNSELDVKPGVVQPACVVMMLQGGSGAIRAAQQWRPE